jgi:ATP-dependent Lon protease
VYVIEEAAAAHDRGPAPLAHCRCVEAYPRPPAGPRWRRRHPLDAAALNSLTAPDMAIHSTEDLPLFPLGLVLYPGEALPLHIFEFRYRELIRFCMETDEPFGVVMVEEDRMATVGCTARVERVLRRYDDGRMDIVVRGEERFRIAEVRQERPYLTATVESYEGIDNLPDPSLRERVITLHMKLVELSGDSLRPSQYEGPKHVSYVVAQNAGLDLARKQELLEIRSEQQRLDYLGEHLEQMIPEVERARSRARRIRSNGHFKSDDADA